jgi:hypothetical protein
MNTNDNTRTLQLWPNGTTIHVKGDTHGPTLRVKLTASDRWRKATTEEQRAIDIEERAELFLERDILCCDSSLVSELIQHAYDLPRDLQEAFNLEECVNLRPDPSDWNLDQCRDYLNDHGIGTPEPDPYDLNREQLTELLASVSIDSADNETVETLLAAVISNRDDETLDGLKEWREAVQDNAEEREVYEWWRVSSWLASQLKKIGEPVLDNGYGYWWGRCRTGQSMLMDGTLQEVAALHAR